MCAEWTVFACASRYTVAVRVNDEIKRRMTGKVIELCGGAANGKADCRMINLFDSVARNARATVRWC